MVTKDLKFIVRVIPTPRALRTATAIPAFAPTLSLLLKLFPVVGTACPFSGGVAGAGGPGGLVGNNGGGGGGVVVDALTLVVGDGAAGGGTLAGSYTVASNFMPAVQLAASFSKEV